MSDVEKDCLRQELSNKILLLNQLREEALELEKQMERQQEDMAKKEKELGELQHFIDSLDPEDPRHVSFTHTYIHEFNIYSINRKCQLNY